MSLRRKLFFILLILTIIPIFALGTALTLQSIRNQIQEITNAQNSIAAQISLQASDIINHVELHAKLFSYENNLFALSDEERKIALTGFMTFEGDIEQVTLLNDKGSEITRISQSRIITESQLINRSNDAEFIHPMLTKEVYYGPINISDEINEPIVTIAIPIHDPRTDMINGVLVIDSKLAAMWSLVEDKSQELNQEIFVISSSGLLIAHPNRSAVLRRETFDIPENENLSRGINNELSIMGWDVFRTGDQKFTVIAMQPIRYEYGNIFTSVAITVGTILITSLIALLLAYRFGTTISTPIIKLAQIAESMKDGNLNQTADVQSNDEIGRLAITFNEMAQKINSNISTLVALQDSTQIIIHELDMDRVLQAIMQQLIKLLSVEHSFLFLVEEDGSCIRMYLGTGLNSSHIGETLLPGEGISGRVWKSGKPLFLSHYDIWPERPKMFEQAPFHSIAAAPLISTGTILGVLGINYTKTSHAATEEDVELLVKFAHLASIAIGNARLYKKAQDELIERKKAEDSALLQLNRLKALHNIDTSITSSFNIRITLNTILKELISHIHVDAADIILFNSGMNTFEIGYSIGFKSKPKNNAFPRAQAGLASLTAQQQTTLYIADLTGNTLYHLGFVEETENFISYYGCPLYIKGELKGILEIYQRSPRKLSEENLEYFETLATQTAIAIDNHTMFDNLQKTNKDLQIAYETTLEGWSAALDLRDKETEGHTLRVTDLTLALAKNMNVRESELIHIRRGALLHDIGKMGIPDSILQKPGKLTDKERRIIEKHPVYAYNLISPIPYLQPALDIPYCHHEKWDGTGYPRKLKGKKIPFAARLFAVVDVYDALTSNRPYRKSWSKEETLEYIQSESGTHFDPDVVQAFIQMIMDS